MKLVAEDKVRCISMFHERDSHCIDVTYSSDDDDSTTIIETIDEADSDKYVNVGSYYTIRITKVESDPDDKSEYDVVTSIEKNNGVYTINCDGLTIVTKNKKIFDYLGKVDNVLEIELSDYNDSSENDDDNYASEIRKFAEAVTETLENMADRFDRIEQEIYK